MNATEQKMRKVIYIWEKISDEDARLYRVLGTDGIVNIPGQIDGHSVSELGTYCFSRRRLLQADLFSTSLFEDGTEITEKISTDFQFLLDQNSYLHELSEKYIQQVQLPASLRKIGSCAFYNCSKMKELVSLATVTTPNITEACILLGKQYKNGEYSLEEIEEIAKEIGVLGPKKVVITGIIKGSEIINFAYDMDEDKKYIIVNNHSDRSFGGTGDIFASIICGMLMRGKGFEEAVKKASEFVYKAISYSDTKKIDVKNGVVFEPILKELFI